MRITLSAVLLIIAFNSVAKDCVVLLHGLARSAGAMETMQQALDNAGYFTVNVEYPSREHTIADIPSSRKTLLIPKSLR